MPMNYEEAKRQLVLHAGAIDEAQKAMILEDGFLPSLRPYRGLQEKNIHLVMEALLTVGERIHSAPQVDRELITTIWWMCTTARLWGLRPDGMLQACKLLTAEDILRLELWVNAIEETALSVVSQNLCENLSPMACENSGGSGSEPSDRAVGSAPVNGH